MPPGWVVVWRDVVEGRTWWEVAPTVLDIVDTTPKPDVVGIDIPIGLVEAGPRACDLEARRLLGLPRSSSVFPAPIRPILDAGSYAEASARRHEIEGKRVSVQAWGIVPKIREVDQALRDDPSLSDRVREVHPELCFMHMNRGRPMEHGKKSAKGRDERLRLLRHEFGELIDKALGARPPGCQADDLLDAFAAMWTSLRIAQGQGVIIPTSSIPTSTIPTDTNPTDTVSEAPPVDRHGLRMEMVTGRTKTVLYVDMDGVLVDFKSGIERLSEADRQEYEGHYDDAPDIFGRMDPQPGAVEAFVQLSTVYDTYILSTSPWKNPSAWSDKLRWVQRHLGDAAYKRLILTHHKDLNAGDALIDDNVKNGAGEFEGELVLFDREEPDWPGVVEHLLRKADVDGELAAEMTRKVCEAAEATRAAEAGKATEADKVAETATDPALQEA